MTGNHDPMIVIIALGLGISLVSVSLVSFNAKALEWTTETIDHQIYSGSHSSVYVDPVNYTHVSYRRETHGFVVINSSLMYALWNGSTWRTEIVDTENVGLGTSLVVDRRGFPHISYSSGDRFPAESNDLLYASWNGTAWSIVKVDDSDSCDGINSALALESRDYPVISHFSCMGLKVAKWNGTAWRIEILDQSTTMRGWFSSIATDQNDNIHVAYTGDVNAGLTYQKWDGNKWNITLVTPAYSRTPSIAIDPIGNPHISFSSVAAGILHAKLSGESWILEHVDSDAAYCLFDSTSWTSIAIGGQGDVHIGYPCPQRNQESRVRYATLENGKWVKETIGSQSGFGTSRSLALDVQGYVHITYQGVNDTLQHAKARAKTFNSQPPSTPAGMSFGTFVLPVAIIVGIIILVLLIRRTMLVRKNWPPGSQR